MATSCRSLAVRPSSAEYSPTDGHFDGAVTSALPVVNAMPAFVDAPPGIVNHGSLPLVTAAHLVGIDYAAHASVGSTSKLSPDEAGGFPDELRRLHRAQVEVRLDAGLGRYD
jgi:hypothetical protein